ncbi:MAG: hypothetical protein WCI04_06315 [archaeon]
MENEIIKSKPVRMHPRNNNKAGIMSDTGEIPSGCTSNLVNIKNLKGVFIICVKF